MVPGGFDAIVDEIVRSNADFVTLSEVRNYKDVDFTNRLVDALQQKGLTYYSFLSYDSGVLSKYKIREHKAVYPLANDHGSIYKLVTMIGDQRIAVYTAHLDYTNYACYLPRGYDGLTWKKIPAPVTDTMKIKKMNTASYREDEIRTFIKDADEEIAKGSFVFFGEILMSLHGWIGQKKQKIYTIIMAWCIIGMRPCFCIMPVSLIPIAMQILLP